MIYTYILKDVDNDIFKIGKTSIPQNRFDKLCMKDRVYPVALYAGDHEKELHEAFKSNRTDHPDISVGGYTEYFKRGGKFSEFIEPIESAKIPYCKPMNLVKEMMETGKVLLADPFLLYELTDDKFGWYTLGKILLQGLGKIHDNGGGWVEPKSRDVSYIEHKLAITSDLYDEILNDDDIEIRVYEDQGSMVVNVEDMIYSMKLGLNTVHIVVGS